MSSTGIAVFAYNRPNHLERVLSGLRENDVEKLYVFIDGPENEEHKQQVEAVRTIIDDVSWCEKTVVDRDRNLGLATSITNGVDQVLEENDRVIVLEDDCVPADNFVTSMRRYLTQYEDSSRVMSVTGYSPPVKIPEDYPYDVYFTYRNSSWGWGTWKDAWNQFEHNPMSLKELRENKTAIKNQIDRAGTDLYRKMKKQLSGEIDSWAMWWAYTICLHDGVCVNPIKSKISNIGHDGTGTHCGESERYTVELDGTAAEKLSLPDEPFVDDEINTRYNDFFTGGQQRRVKKLVKYLLETIGLLERYRTLRYQ